MMQSVVSLTMHTCPYTIMALYQNLSVSLARRADLLAQTAFSNICDYDNNLILQPCCHHQLLIVLTIQFNPGTVLLNLNRTSSTSSQHAQHSWHANKTSNIAHVHHVDLT